MTRFVVRLLAGVYLLALSTPLQAQDADAGYLLQYKLQAGEEIVTTVSHFADTRTKITDHEEASTSRTTSEKVWRVTGVNKKGEMTFVYQINSVALAQQVGEDEELSYDSKSDEEIPDMFRKVAETVAKPLATVTINAQGQVVDRDEEMNAPNLGMGDLTIPLPATRVVVGGSWNVPRELRAKSQNGVYKKIKVREHYTLEKVAAGVATISIVTQPLTPISDAGIEAQLLQQMSEGEIKFDINRGRLLSKRLDWSEEVIGFEGPESWMRYDAKFIEELVDAKRTASRTPTKTK